MWGEKLEMIPTVENCTKVTLIILKDVMNKAEVSFQKELIFQEFTC